MLTSHVLASLKAYTALIGSICTALLGIYGPDDPIGRVLTIVLAIVTAVGTWAVPNLDGDTDGAV